MPKKLSPKQERTKFDKWFTGLQRHYYDEFTKSNPDARRVLVGHRDSNGIVIMAFDRDVLDNGKVVYHGLLNNSALGALLNGYVGEGQATILFNPADFQDFVRTGNHPPGH